MTSFLELSGISMQGAEGHVLRDITFSQRRFQKIVVAGETGSGKTSLLKIIGGLAQPDAGQATFKGEPVIGPNQMLVPGHPGISYLSQHFELPKFLRVEQVLGYSNTLTDEAADTLFEVCHISHLMTRKTDQLSGGERQRIALAQRLITAPQLLLLDEPFSNLDLEHKRVLKSVIANIGARLKITCMLVSHEPADTLPWADKILVLKAGQAVQWATPEKVYQHPASTYVAGLFGKYTRLTTGTFNTLFPAAAIKTKRKHVLVRPEHFHLSAKSKRALKGKVTGIHFLGGHSELEVFTSGVHLILQTPPTPSLTTGADVYVTIEPGKAHAVD